VLKVECIEQAGAGAPTVLSAVALDDDGYIVTVGLRSPLNRTFVVKDCAGKKHEARWVAGDEPTGLALLKLEPGVAHPPPMTTSLPAVGSAVIVVGNPFGLSHSVSVGVVSGLDRTISFSGGVSRGMIQFTAPVFPGDGGGLLADHDGRMLGLVSTALKDPATDEASDHRISGIAFAIPAPELHRIVQRLRDGQKVERGYLGLTAEDVEGVGVRVIHVVKDSPAQKARIREGDLLEALDDRAVIDFDDLAGRIERLRPGMEVTLHVKRADEELDVQATLGDRPGLSGSSRRVVLPPWPDRTDPKLAPSSPRWDFDHLRRIGPSIDVDGAMLGVHTQAVTESLAKSLGLPSREGALVNSVMPGSPADRAGLRASDVIISLNDEAVRSPLQLHERIRKLEPQSKVRVQFVRDGKAEAVEVTLGQAAPGIATDEAVRWPGTAPWPAESLRMRLEALEEHVKVLETRLNELQRRLDGKAPAPAPREP
jgi:serine protease Do